MNAYTAREVGRGWRYSSLQLAYKQQCVLPYAIIFLRTDLCSSQQKIQL